MENANYSSDIAIIGMSGRFPGANSLSEFWNNLCEGKESISFFSDQELIAAGISLETLNQPHYVKAKAILEKADLFDAEFFGFSPREAEALDPQQRLFLECAWEALENAGYCSENKTGRIGVYAGSSMNNYYSFHLLQNREFRKQVGDFQLMISNMPDALCTRVSYEFNLTGPSITIQTSCSTSLVAVAVACQELLNFQCDLALAGGVSLLLPIKTGYLYKEGMILSQDGHCRPFDKKAEGTVLGMGCGAVILKRLEDALKDRDSIYAVIKGFAINNDGSNKIGYTAPSADGQINVISEAQGMANVNPETISYIEAHGTATKLGDPIEIMALTKAFRESTDKKQFCAIGSLKSNIGHLDAAAGIAGLMKTTLALHNRLLPPTLHFQESNPHINFEDSPFYVQTELAPWKSSYPRRAGVSAFGIGGTNAHVILEEAPTNQRPTEEREWHLFILSSKISDTLVTATHNLFHFLKENPTLNLSDVAYTLAVGRKSFNYRRMFIIKDKNVLLNQKDILMNNSTHDQNVNLKDIEEAIYHILTAHHQDLLDEHYHQLYQEILQKSTEHGMNLSDIVAQKNLFDKKDFLSLLGELWLKGAEIEWDLVYSVQKPSRVPLPTYPFQRKRYWIEPDRPDVSIPKSSNPLSQEDVTLTTTPTEQALIKIWQSHFGIQEIHPTDDFFALGGDSLLAIDVIYQINQDFKSDLSSSTLLSSSRIIDLAQQIDSKALSALPFTIVPLKKGDPSYTPLFLIHPAGGTVYYYNKLVSCLPEYQPVYGVQAKSFDGKTTIPETIEEMAKDYLQDITTVQPQGPYQLAGASFGGIVAYEIAVLLSKAGKQINFLGLIDSPSPGFLPDSKNFIDVPAIVKYILEVSDSHNASLDDLRNLSEEELTDYFIDHSKTKVEGFKNQAKMFFNIFHLNLKSMYNYLPKPYTGKVVFFKALEENLYLSKNLEQGWHYLVPEGLEVIDIPGNHITMINLPHVTVLAKRLQFSLNTFLQVEDTSIPIVKHNEYALSYLENYSRYAVSKISIPEKYLDKYNQLVRAIKNISVNDSIDKFEIISKYPEIEPHIKLIDHCIEFYPEVLSGKTDHMTVLFPDGKLKLMEGIYQDNPMFDYVNKMIARAVLNYLKIMNKIQPNIIEIGAGTGSSTKFILPLIKETNPYYYFTDISLVFLKDAKNNFNDYKNITYQIYNIEEPPLKELNNKFDIVVANNVLHATRDMEKTLSNVKALLKENGMLILGEGTRKYDFSTIVFGLTPGWWLYDDHEYRIPDTPLLSLEIWHKLLKKSGFTFIKYNEDNQRQISSVILAIV